jgi:Uma2 family endonuclease
MTQAKPRFAAFEDYLAYSNEVAMEGYYELIEGELVELPPESRLNSTIAVRILLALIAVGISTELIHPGKCEVQVPILRRKDAANRYPDLVILREEHLELTQRRLTITLDMPPPRLIVEVVSPGKTNRDRDYINKRAQYAAIGVPEYWLIDPEAKTVLVLELKGEDYREVGLFYGNDTIKSVELTELKLTAAQVFAA